VCDTLEEVALDWAHHQWLLPVTHLETRFYEESWGATVDDGLPVEPDST
jgi:hypothetical protein